MTPSYQAPTDGVCDLFVFCVYFLNISVCFIFRVLNVTIFIRAINSNQPIRRIQRCPILRPCRTDRARYPDADSDAVDIIYEGEALHDEGPVKVRKGEGYVLGHRLGLWLFPQNATSDGKRNHLEIDPVIFKKDQKNDSDCNY